MHEGKSWCWSYKAIDLSPHKVFDTLMQNYVPWQQIIHMNLDNYLPVCYKGPGEKKGPS